MHRVLQFAPYQPSQTSPVHHPDFKLVQEVKHFKRVLLFDIVELCTSQFSFTYLE